MSYRVDGSLRAAVVRKQHGGKWVDVAYIEDYRVYMDGKEVGEVETFSEVLRLIKQKEQET